MKKIIGFTAILVMLFAFLVINECITFARVTSSAIDRDVWCVGVSGTEVCVDSSGNFIPTTTNSVDLGTSALEFKNLYLDGTATVDAISNSGAYTGTTGTFSGTVTMTTATVSGYFSLQRKTIAEIEAITPSVAGQMYVCSDCVHAAVCVSSSTGVSSWVAISSPTVACT